MLLRRAVQQVGDAGPRTARRRGRCEASRGSGSSSNVAGRRQRASPRRRAVSARRSPSTRSARAATSKTTFLPAFASNAKQSASPRWLERPPTLRGAERRRRRRGGNRSAPAPRPAAACRVITLDSLTRPPADDESRCTPRRSRPRRVTSTHATSPVGAGSASNFAGSVADSAELRLRQSRQVFPRRPSAASACPRCTPAGRPRPPRAWAGRDLLARAARRRSRPSRPAGRR